MVAELFQQIPVSFSWDNKNEKLSKLNYFGKYGSDKNEKLTFGTTQFFKILYHSNLLFH